MNVITGPLQKSAWIQRDDIRPYVFVRPDNQIEDPGRKHRLPWFDLQKVIHKNPMDVKEVHFADRIYSIESRAFGPSNMMMPRWVFYDCAVIPGLVAGFAIKSSAMSLALQEALDIYKHPAYKTPVETSTVLKPLSRLQDLDWVPLSLFIIIPTMHRGEWVAHNLCSVNSFLPVPEQFYGLGFLTKAFGLWYANVLQCTGMTQWGSPALKLHSHYGHLEVIGAYSPVHSHAQTVTYRVNVDTACWERFFTKEVDLAFLEKYCPTHHTIDPVSEQSMLDLQLRIENKEGPFYLSASEIAEKKLKDQLTIYKEKSFSL